MLILGVCNATDSGACLIRDGKIIAAVNEERFTRKKNITVFPRLSIQYFLKTYRLRPRDIDWIGCGAWNALSEPEVVIRLIEDVVDQIENAGSEDAKEIALQRIEVSRSRDIVFKRELLEGLSSMGFLAQNVIFCDHHYSHALTAFYCSPFEEAYVLSADARGDFLSVSLWSATRKEGLKRINFATEITSPGALYGFVTKVLGFTPDRHEGKITGLSAHGKMTKAYDILMSGFWFDAKKGRIRSRIGDTYRPFMTADWPKLHELLKPFSREDIAFAVQKILEETLTGFLMHSIGSLPKKSTNLCLAGGCMSNVRLNYKLFNLKPIKDVYVFPQMGDGGNALGGAIHVALTKDKRKYFNLPTVYLGPDYKDAEIHKALKGQRVTYKRVTSQEKIRQAVRYILEGKIVGWFGGRMEYGPRALGSRSILAEAKDKKITELLNQKLHRSDFMPFAPVTIPEYAAKSFIGWKDDHLASRFMTICYQCTPYIKKKCPAVVHVDGSARPQVIFREQNPEYYDVIKLYIEQSKNPVLINTSFNNHEEPIINSPHEAIQSLLKGNVDILIAGNFIISPS